MIEIKHATKHIGSWECSAIVDRGMVKFDLTHSDKFPVFKTVYKNTIELKTDNSKFVYSFSDCEVIGNEILSVQIIKSDGISYDPANGIKIYLSIKGELTRNPIKEFHSMKNKRFKKFTETTFAIIFVVVLFSSLVYVFGQVSKVRARSISCKAFTSHYLAQQYYNEQESLKKEGLLYDRNYVRLDGDGDGIACESLF